MTSPRPVLLSTCPRCQSEPQDTSGFIVQLAQRFCPNPDCQVFAWDPHITAEEFEASATVVDLTPVPTSGGVPLTEEYMEELAAEAEAGYDPDRLIPRPVRPDAADR